MFIIEKSQVEIFLKEKQMKTTHAPFLFINFRRGRAGRGSLCMVLIFNLISDADPHLYFPLK